MIAAGVRDRTAEIGHHNVWFASDDRAEFAALEAGRMADAPTIYGCVSAVTDPSQAPAGDENWFILVNTPPGIELDAAAEHDRVLDRLAAHGVDLRQRLAWSEVLTPADFESRYRRARRCDLRDLVERPAGRVPASGESDTLSWSVPGRWLQPSGRRLAARGDQRPHRR